MKPNITIVALNIFKIWIDRTVTDANLHPGGNCRFEYFFILVISGTRVICKRRDNCRSFVLVIG